jgi:hypothetical protein
MFIKREVGLLKPSNMERERQRYYLFAGMGGRPARRKHRAFLMAALISAVLVSAALMGLFVWINAV